MITNIRQHKTYYIVLLVLELVGFFLILSAVGNKSLQMAYVVLTTFIYVIWGIVHHYVHHDVQSKIVLEYILMGSFGISVMFFLLH